MNYVECSSMVDVLEVSEQCKAEGYKVMVLILSRNSWEVRYWK